MKTIINIGGRQWIAPDAAKAAKVADLLNDFQPINRDWRNSKKTIYVIGRGADHQVSIQGIPEDIHLVKNIQDAVKLRDASDEKSLDTI